MLLCNLDEARAGMVVGAVILHPRRPETQLLEPGVRLDSAMLSRLRELGVGELWVHHDALADLDHLVSPQLSEARRDVYRRIREDFAEMSARTLTVTQVQTYRQSMMRLVCELIGSRKIAGLTGQLFSKQASLFSHGANVAYLAMLAGLELEPYIVAERRRLPLEHARDLTSLGLGAMLHDLGKLGCGPAAPAHHEVFEGAGPAGPEGYREHPVAGYRLLRGSRAPASAAQAVLNHHQRYDGRGWPGLGALTHQRRAAALAGKQIHVFTRIVAVANVLDNLLRDAHGAARPPVAALHDLAGSRFAGWFDPRVVQVLVRRLPPFPLGSCVRLSNGRAAAVVAPNLHQPCRPVVRLLAEADRDPHGRYPTLRLADHPHLHIAQCAGVAVSRWLFTLPEKERAGRK